MTRAQAWAFFNHAQAEYYEEAHGITQALTLADPADVILRGGRYIVRDSTGAPIVSTNELGYANATRYNCSGTIYDRQDWRNAPTLGGYR